MSNGNAPRVSMFDLINQLGPKAVLEFTAPLGLDDEVKVDEYVTRYFNGSYASALGVHDANLAADIDALMGVKA